MSIGVGLALLSIGITGGGAPPALAYPNGFRYQLQRIIPAAVHQMPDGGSCWVQYRHTAVALKSVANGGKVENGTFLDHRFEAGNTVIHHELESWSATVGSIVAWLFLTGFRAGLDYSIFHYYGNATLALPQSDPAAAWAGYSESVNLATGADMTGNEHNFTLTSVGAATLFGADAGDFG